MHEKLVRPGFFAEPIAADNERMCYDFHNDAILSLGIKPDFVFIGDSITQFWDLPLFFGREKLLLNRGIGGDVPKYILRRFEADVLQLHPEYCVMMAGTNCSHDLEDNPWLGMKGHPFEEVTQRTIESILAVIRCAMDAGQKIIVGAIPPAIVPPVDRRNEMIPLVNAEVRKFCKDNQIVFVDYYSALVDPETKMMQSGYTTDGIHPDSRGFRVMTQVLRSTLHENGIEI